MAIVRIYRILPNINALPENSPFILAKTYPDGKVLAKLYIDASQAGNHTGLTNQQVIDQEKIDYPEMHDPTDTPS